MKPAREPASSRPKPCASLNKPTNFARAPLLVALVGRKMTVVRYRLFPQKPPGSRLWFSRTGVQPSPGLSTIELPSAFAESGAYPPGRSLPGSPRQCSLPLACRHPPEGYQIEARKGRTPQNIILSQPCPRRVSTDRPNREGRQLAASLEGEPGPTPAGKTLPHSYLETRFRRERARGYIAVRTSLSWNMTKLYLFPRISRRSNMGTPIRRMAPISAPDMTKVQNVHARNAGERTAFTMHSFR